MNKPVCIYASAAEVEIYAGEMLLFFVTMAFKNILIQILNM